MYDERGSISRKPGSGKSIVNKAIKTIEEQTSTF